MRLRAAAPHRLTCPTSRPPTRNRPINGSAGRHDLPSQFLVLADPVSPLAGERKNCFGLVRFERAETTQILHRTRQHPRACCLDISQPKETVMRRSMAVAFKWAAAGAALVALTATATN